MSENFINSKIHMNQKNSKKYFGVLRRLAQSEDSVINKIKVIVSEGVIEESNHCFIAPSKFKNFSENSVDKNSTKKTSVNSFENSNEEKKNLSSQLNIETVDYPDSSDFSDDEDDE